MKGKEEREWWEETGGRNIGGETYERRREIKRGKDRGEEKERRDRGVNQRKETETKRGRDRGEETEGERQREET